MDMRLERRTPVPFPAGDTRFSMARTFGFTRDPLTLLLDAYERYGPVFTQRVFHQNIVFVLGPEANHHLLVSNAQNYSWRHGHYGDLSPLLGDGLLAIDGAFHRLQRKAMLPMFHRERIAKSQELMVQEVDDALAGWQDGQQIDLYHWTRELALRIAMRALFGIDPDSARGHADAAQEFENALEFWSKDYILQIMRGPGTPWRKMRAAAQRLDTIIYAEIDRRRATGDLGDDLLGLLLDAQDGDGLELTNRHIRDEVMTLLFAGHDTTTSTIAFLFYELGRHPGYTSSEDFDLSAALDETLRTRRPGSARAARSRRPRSPASTSPAASRSSTPRGSPTTSPTSGRTPSPSSPSGSSAPPRTRSPRAPTSPSAAAPGPASGCASARPRSTSSPPGSSAASGSRSTPATS
jgi:cytochrome P450